MYKDRRPQLWKTISWYICFLYVPKYWPFSQIFAHNFASHANICTSLCSVQVVCVCVCVFWGRQIHNFILTDIGAWRGDKYTNLYLTDIRGDKYTSINLTDIWFFLTDKRTYTTWISRINRLCWGFGWVG